MGNIQCKDLSLAFGDRQILENINISISDSSRCALTGANGSGKSTLMKILHGSLPPDSGKIIKTRGIRVSYLPQSGILHSGAALFEEAEKAFDYLQDWEIKKIDLETRLGTVTPGEGSYDGLLEDHHRIEQILLKGGYYDRKQAIEKTLSGLGFSLSDTGKLTEHFSGGWQMRIALAKVLLAKPDILLLDEPTNYLDLEARMWLQEFLAAYPGGILMVSHDRHFLDSTVSETLEIFGGTVKRYAGNYSSYLKKRGEELKTLISLYKKQQEEIRKTEDFIQKFRYNASKAKLVQSRIKWLEKLNRIELPQNIAAMHFAFPPAPHSGRKTLSAENLGKSYGENRVFSQLSFSLDRGEKVFLGGVNGSGKSTLLRIAAGRDSRFSGSITPGKDVAAGYFSQDIEESLNLENTVIEEIEEHAPNAMIPSLRNILGSFLFSGDDIYKPVSVLSGGEKSRIALLKLLLKPYNFLILDEPTNHLDIVSKEILLHALQEYKGTVLFVSHDRFFIENLATRVFELRNGRLRIYHGDYFYYLWKLETTENNQELIVNKTAADNSGREKREEENKRRNALQKLQRLEHSILEKISALEEEKASLNSSLHEKEIYSDLEKAGEVSRSIEEITRKIDEYTQTWEKIHKQLISGEN